MPVKPMDISVKLAHKPSAPKKSKDIVSFLEIRGEGESIMLPGRLQERIIGGRKEYYVTSKWMPYRIEHDISAGAGMSIVTGINVGAGIFVNAKVKTVFHPVQHQFKMAQDRLEQDVQGNIRRWRRRRGDPCYIDDDEREDWEILPQDIYPACYPASWAALCSSYRMTPLHPRRRWEMGTPTELNPPPNDFGDFFSTWVMGEEHPWYDPSVTRIEDWQDIQTDPTPRKVVMDRVRFVHPDPNNITDQDRKHRAALIKNTLINVVGGEFLQGGPDNLPFGWIPGHPVRMNHGGHGWVVVGISQNGFWSHAWEDNDSWAFSNYCIWSEAEWNTDDIDYAVSYPPSDCRLKPEKRRLGCINLEGSSDAYERVRFHDVFDGQNVIVIHWTPHTRTTPGYLWIPGNVPLDCSGFPRRQTDPEFNKDLFGQRIPQPSFDFGDCPHCNDSSMGCPHCRSRLLLPFWVHNTTLDEVVTYKVDMQFWAKSQRWDPHEVNLPASYDNLYGFDRGEWNAYGLPGFIPGANFAITAKRDNDRTMNRRTPWNSQGFAWFIDFYKDDLALHEIQGIRLVLTCVKRSSEQINLVQDVKQIWFKVGGFDHLPLHIPDLGIKQPSYSH